MATDSIAESTYKDVIRQYNWSNFSIAESVTANAKCVPKRLASLIESKDKSEAEKWYWLLENTIVVQGGICDSAFPSIHILLAAIHKTEMSKSAEAWVFELINQCLFGYPYELRFSEYPQKCIDLVRRHFQLLEKKSKDSEVLRSIVEDIHSKINEHCNEVK